jgi:hypothetical protein
MKDRLRNFFGAAGYSVLAIGFIAGQPLTFVYLVWQDAKDTDGFLAWLVVLAADGFLAAIWPIYWAILHWL